MGKSDALNIQTEKLRYKKLWLRVFFR